MSIIPKLAASLNRRDEVPNVELASFLAGKEDKMSVSELVLNLNNRNKAIRHDCIKVLYEIAKLKPRMIAGHYRLFVAILGNADNRMQWGAMTALDYIAMECPREIFISIRDIVKAAGKGSVITRDHCVNILIKLALIDKYYERAFPMLLEQLSACPTIQLPMYAENAVPVVNATNRDMFVSVLTSRLDELDKASRKKRVEKVIRKVSGSFDEE